MMTGKPWIVAVLAGMVVAMIGVVFLQQAPEGYIVSALMQVDRDSEGLLEAELREEAAREAGKDGNSPIDPHSIQVLRAAGAEGEFGVDVAVQAQGRNARSAMDYLNELMVRYARRASKVDESAKVKLEIDQAERRLAEAAKQRREAEEQIESHEREIHQLLERERFEAERLAEEQRRFEEQPVIPAPVVLQPAAPSSPPGPIVPPALSPPVIRETPKVRAAEPAQEAEPPLPELSVPAPKAPKGNTLTEEERVEIEEAIKVLKTQRMKLLNDGRRAAHPEVQKVDRQIRDLEEQLKGGSGEEELQRVQFEAPIADERPLTKPSKEAAALRQLRNRLEAEVKTLQIKQRQAVKIETQQKEILRTLVERHDALEAQFKPVILAPATIASQIEAPFPWSRLWGVVSGSLIAAVMGYVFARWGRERRVIRSTAEAEQVLRMPVQKLERPRRRRAA